MNIETWVKAYTITLGNKRNYRMRLWELQTWDKPLNPKDNDPYNKWSEWETKIEALKYLLL